MALHACCSLSVLYIACLYTVVQGENAASGVEAFLRLFTANLLLPIGVVTLHTRVCRLHAPVRDAIKPLCQGVARWATLIWRSCRGSSCATWRAP